MRNIYIILLLFVCTPQFNYGQDVLKSYLNREYIRYSSNNHNKSLGIDIVIDLPKAFKASEGKRPHIVQKWNYQVPNTEALLISVYLIIDMLDQEVLESNRMLGSDFTKAIIEELNYRCLKSGEIKVDGINASYAVGEKTRYNDLIGMKMHSIDIIVNTSYNNRLIQLMFSTSGINKSEVISWYNKYELLYTSIINSIAIQNQWVK